MYSLTFFAVDLFSRLELGGASTVAVAVAAARCAGTAAGCLLLLRTGRRRLHLAGSAAVCLAMGLVAAVVSLRGAGWLADRPASWALVCLFMLFMFLVGTSVVSLPWVLMGKSFTTRLIVSTTSAAEWFSPELKSVVSGFLITLQFFTIFAAVQTTNPILAAVGNSGLFIFFCAVCALNTIFIALFVPETHGKTYISLSGGK